MRKDYMSYTGDDKIKIIEPQCKKCKNNITPIKCKEFNVKPKTIILNEQKCSKYME